MSSPVDESLSFPRLQARSLRFTLGVPRNLTVSPDGSRVFFVRTPDGSSRTGSLWAYDADKGEETCLVDASALLGAGSEELSAEERARRERSRESAAGIVGYAMDDACEVATFALSGKVWVARTRSAGALALPTAGSAIDPRVDPTGRRIAYATDGSLRVIGVDGTLDYPVVEPDGEHVVWGLAEFVAAEEMDRFRGYWWAPDGESLLVERYDESPVETWYVADPADPSRAPVEHRYPAAGTANALVSLWHVRLDGTRTEVVWDRETFPYLTRVSWTSHGEPLVQVMSRDQKHAGVLAVELDSGETTLVRAQSDDVWVDLMPGVPAYAPGGRLVTLEDHADTKTLFVDGKPVSPRGLQIRRVVSLGAEGAIVTASQDPTQIHLHAVGWDGETVPLAEGPGVWSGDERGGTAVRVREGMESPVPTVTVMRHGSTVGTITSHPLDPGLHPEVSFLEAGDHGIRTAVLFPRGHVVGSRAALPIIMNPYAGPHAQRVLHSAKAYLQAQWMADQGFCVVIADGRGTPGRGRAWDRAIRDDVAGVTLEDQVTALETVIDTYGGDVDRSRVGIMGWSYGGYLAALAVLRRPDVFHAAVAGAPVTEWRLYDTFYTERYLGDPAEQPEIYDAHSLMVGLDKVDVLPPLMIVHGMVDDNVVVAHTLRLSSALLEAGKPHSVLPLTGVTHMTPQEVVAENLAQLQVDFLRTALRA
ncbi:prolyl oligopeptidase family serine peptidase [Mumia sp. zg.B53]|uniref:S9 family peptidase n=1 Tax=Mumia sp. zg.B53 TaxID=2855449 RepID=UPI001C6EA280|nr:prolyl oligopeptidase family serine peptidase [Mumia sp. zg.B53]MBW9215467.1 prolyl oligopeptidase family serine peptidase [Mumia sp. zg.B53]